MYSWRLRIASLQAFRYYSLINRSKRESLATQFELRKFVSYSTDRSNGTKSRNPLVKMGNFFRNDPFARVSIIFGGTILVVLLVIESFIPKPHKRMKPQTAVLPPQISHQTIQRERELHPLLSSLPSIFSRQPSVVVVTGPPGSGKTELASQFAHKFIDKCSPRFQTKKSKKPIVLYLDASSYTSLSFSSSFSAFSLGIKSAEFREQKVTEPIDMKSTGYDTRSTLELIFAKLGTQKSKWLLIVDGVTQETQQMIESVLGGVVSDIQYRRGCVLLTTPSEVVWSVISPKTIVSLSNGLHHDDAIKLYSKLSGMPHDRISHNVPLNDLLNSFDYSPLPIALAGLTTKLYEHFWQSSGEVEEEEILSHTLSSYIDNVATRDQQQLLNRAVELYLEAVCTVDSYFIHSIDFLASCNLNFPIPVSSVRQHIKNPFYRLPSSPPSSSIMSNSSNDNNNSTALTLPTSYLSLIKSKLPFIGGSSLKHDILQEMAQVPTAVDPLEPLFLSPFLHTSKLGNFDIELLSVHSSVHNLLSDHFLSYSVPRMEKEELKQAEEQWEKNIWFKKFRTFSPTNVLCKFRSTLPGLKDNGVLTEQQYQPENSLLSYSQYLHLVSHYHRLSDTFLNELKYLSRDHEDLLLRKYLSPHIEYLLSAKSSNLTKKDVFRCEAGLLSILASLSKHSNEVYQQYCILLEACKELFGVRHIDVANTLTMMAEILYHLEDYTLAIDLLQQAVSIHDGILPRLRNPIQSLDHAITLSILGLVYASLGDKKQCCKYLEKSLGLFQTIPSDGNISKKQRKLVATTVTDLGHAYISLGDVVPAKKYLDLAIIAQRGIHGNDHPEVARTLNVMSIVYTLMGDSMESRNARREAGEIQDELKRQSDII